MVGALVPGASGPGSSPGRGLLCCVLGQDSHNASLHPGVQYWTENSGFFSCNVCLQYLAITVLKT